MTNERTPTPLKTTETSLAVVEALRDLDGARVNEVADHLDTTPSTIHRHLTTLKKHDYVTKEGDIYRPGLRFLTVAGYLRNREPGYRIATEKVDQLASETGERVQFIVEEHGQRVYIHTAVGEDAVKTNAYMGKRGPLHCSAAGKSILAALPDERVNEIIDRRGLSPVTENTITDRERLLEELERIEKREFAFNREESILGLNAVGTAIQRPDGRVFGALSISGPVHRFKGENLKETIPDLLLGAANELELNIEYME